MEFGKIQNRYFDQDIKEPEKKNKAELKYGCLLTRIPKVFDFIPNPSLTIIFPKITNRNGRICFIFSSSESDIQNFKRNYVNHECIKIFEINNSDELPESKDYLQSFKDIKIFFKSKISSKLMKLGSNVNLNKKNSGDNQEQIKGLCEKVKQYTEKLLIEFNIEIVKAYQEFLINDQISDELDKAKFIGHLVLVICCLFQAKLKPSNMMRKNYFFEFLNMSYFLKKFELFTKDQKIFIIDILYQMAFFKKPFENEKSVFQSIFNIDFIGESTFILKIARQDLAQTISTILHYVGKKYFSMIENNYFSNAVSSFIDSVQVVDLPVSLLGFTQINSLVLISNECVRKTKKFEKIKKSNNKRKGKGKVLGKKAERYLKLLNDAFIIITCVHEFGHFFQRFPSKKLFEWLNFTTPTNFIQLIQSPLSISNFNSETFVATPNLSEASQLVTNQPTPQLNLLNSESEDLINNKIIKETKITESALTKNEVILNPTQFPKEQNELPNVRVDLESEIDESISNEMSSIGDENQVEGGSLLIEAIFGYEPDTLNYYDSIFITDPENWNLDEQEFRRRYNEEKSKINPNDPLKIFPHRCRTRGSFFLNLIGVCMNSRGY